ncbi:MAG: bifunctional oligoribonuclease/PAP phosphatase NrnA [Chloroflexaceae bacterium]|nr:bifunctional oligoribonuclease/PAP phosphatase NrnA [Chloroflexaceae bacterium]
MIYPDPVVAAPAIADLAGRSQRVLVLSHFHPDGDAVGSMLALWHVFQAWGKTAIALASSALPSYTHVLPGQGSIQVYEPGMSLPSFDLVCLVDCANLDRTGPIYEDHAEALMAHPLLVIDHHITNTGEGTVNLVSPEAASCADLIERLLVALNVPITPEIATCLLMGVITDTMSFQTSSTSVQTLQSAARLMAAGADQQAIVREVYYTVPYRTVQLLGLVLSQLRREGDMVWTHISQEMMQQTGAEDDAYDEVLQVMQRIAGVRVCVLFKERHEHEVKLSLRSTPAIDVSAIARTWGGGGHKQAAGATLSMPLEATYHEVLPVVRQRLRTAE